ncbi:MAG: tRNA (adenosine(37)-N6)-threonylcarbamoyltransferase complex transferase subunit TsaD [Acholeplasmatales bacterium]|jgi:N6-L-threonylcarbamoyladenine synthase|nr:tRNA (adenosine(37)-N6)-threonylcarbamoyltransferase complex transferase subunit TsaD [Acholeplasmatales bacterium]
MNLTKNFSEDGNFILSIEIDKKIVTTANGLITFENADLHHIETIEEYRNNGYAKLILNELITELEIRKIKNLFLEVNVNNINAIKLYKNALFEQISIRKKYYNDTFDALIMRKKINEVILAVESSCDETSVSIMENGKIISNVVSSQIDIHKLYGGVVPEIASRNHIFNCLDCFKEALTVAQKETSDIDYVAVTNGPGLIGSLLVGITAANAFAYANKIPLIPINHLIGHIYATFLEHKIDFPLVALLVSGGHTELIYMESHYKFKLIGKTLDDAVGEAYDKVAKVLNLPYPGGPEIDKLSLTGSDIYHFPRVMLEKDSFNFSFSGLKSSVINLIRKFETNSTPFKKEDIARSFQESVVEVLVKKTVKCAELFNTKNIIVSGGVACNKRLREAMRSLDEYNVFIPSPKFCTDNAAMIASACFYMRDKLSRTIKDNIITPFTNGEETYI